MRADGDELWLPLSELRAASGWELKPEGACLDDTCVRADPIRPTTRAGLGLASFTYEIAPDHEATDLAGARADLQQLRIAQVTRDSAL